MADEQEDWGFDADYLGMLEFTERPAARRAEIPALAAIVGQSRFITD
jgi:hypothetical protein